MTAPTAVANPAAEATEERQILGAILVLPADYVTKVFLAENLEYSLVEMSVEDPNWGHSRARYYLHGKAHDKLMDAVKEPGTYRITDHPKLAGVVEKVTANIPVVFIQHDQRPNDWNVYDQREATAGPWGPKLPRNGNGDGE